ncbi:MAG: hypothetical protein CK427_06895 [Leptospira sp.]|nr:MAG: hypothetical protein CK427_06895 [Leptospira sp.]
MDGGELVLDLLLRSLSASSIRKIVSVNLNLLMKCIKDGFKPARIKALFLSLRSLARFNSLVVKLKLKYFKGNKSIFI